MLPCVEILLATYNGDKYLSEQLDSLANQSYSNWILTVHDDGSIDDTVVLLKEFQRRFPSKIRIIEDGIVFGCPVKNFAWLMKASFSNYLMFCDQDDVWFDNKIEKFINCLMKLEREKGAGFPLMVFSDLKVVDANLQVISPSLEVYQKLYHKIALFPKMLRCQNVVTGCAMMFNRNLLERCLPFPDKVLMHDRWLAYIASLDGYIDFINEPTMAYRQHGRNSVGSKKAGLGNFVQRISLSYLYDTYKLIQPMVVNSTRGHVKYGFPNFILEKILVSLFRLLS